MPTLTLKSLPDALYQRLKAQATANRRSLNSEILRCLEQAVASAPIDVASTLARVDRVRESLNIPPLTEHDLRDAKEHGRA